MSTFSFLEKDYKEKGKQVYGILENYVVLDTETTGLNPVQGSIIEVGMVKVENYEIADTFEALINPGENVTSFITNLTGITNKMLEAAPYAEEVMPLVLKFIGNKTVIAHNAGFDISFMTATCQKLYGEPFMNDYLDTVRMSRKLFPEMRHHRLSDLVNRFGINTEVYHRALSDAADTQKCYAYMCDYMADSHIGVESIIPVNKASKRKAKPPSPDAEVYGKNFVVSEKLSIIPSKTAVSVILKMGGFCNENERADYIIMGNIEYEMMYSFGGSGDELRISGDGPRIISETRFMEMIKKA